MTYIHIDDGSENKEVYEDIVEWEVIDHTYDLFNTHELAIRIAYKMLDEEEPTIKQIKAEVNKHLKPFLDEIIDETAVILEENNRKIKY